MEQTLFNPDMESISASDQEKLEKSLLLDQIEYVYGHSKMYQDKFSKAGISKDKIKDVKDLALLPFTTKQGLRNSQKRLAPFGDFLVWCQGILGRRPASPPPCRSLPELLHVDGRIYGSFSRARAASIPGFIIR